MKKLSQILILVLFCAGIILYHSIDNSRNHVVLTPWAGIGGCGAGGSGGSGGDGFKWIGQGTSGGLLEIETMSKTNVGQDFHFLTVAPRFSFKPTWSSKLGLSIPFTSKTSEVQYRTNQSANDRTTGGMGDISIDYSRNFGSAGQYALNIAFTLPTGQYDIKRGPDAAQEFLPANLQKGGGIYSSTLGIDYTKDVESGIWLYNASFSLPFNVSFNGENRYVSGDADASYLSDYSNLKNDDRFYYHFKGYGENDFGDYTNPSLTTSLYYGYRGQPNYVHSFGVTFSAPLGVNWIRSEKTKEYNPRPDPDFQAWTAAIVYGMEFSNSEYPIFVTVSLPIHDKSESNPEDEWDTTPMKKWNSPDMKDFLQQWNLGIGIKSSLF